MPRVLLDHRIDEAAMAPDVSPNHRWSRRRPAPATVDTVVAAATRTPAQAAPTERPRAVAAARLGGRPGISAEVLSDLRAADGLLGMNRPTAPQPRPRDPFAWQQASAALVHTLLVAYDDIADELEAALAELAELAPYTAKAEVA